MITLDVLGRPLAAGKKVLFHEHIQFGWPGFDLDYRARRTDVARAVAVLDELAAAGYGTVVDATTIECGRDLSLLRRIAEQTAIQLVASTGIYHAGRGFPDHLASLSGTELADLFAHDFEAPTPESAAGRAGVIKIAVERLPLAKREAKVIAAAGQLSAGAGVSVVGHTVFASVATEVLDIFESQGAEPGRIVLGHLDNERLNLQALKQLADRGAFLGIDRLGAGGEAADNERLELITALRDAGYLDSILIAHDRPLTFLGRIETNFGSNFESGNPFLHIERVIVPALLRRGFAEADVCKLLIDNPARFLSGAGPLRPNEGR